ncbi:thromboxane-A synthase [Kryptolebias marmoratus]|uniref:Thromboxane-A synthase n=1 Tax=Kryptolebias marmoratus TaxID=37003 RepID=A0A2L0EBX3_KRYMA|nr:thromboxane-A synthase [Kryptolebias marmoratus]AUX14926.1 cytochrome p450 CYP5A6 [Kryptolebias marmoratus]
MKTLGDFLNVFNIEANTVSVTFSLVLIFLGLLYWYSVYPFSVLSRCGIKHPKPVPFFGNMLMFREGFYKPLIDIVKTHGKVCGYYFGRKPVVMIADPDVLRKVMVKDFSSFANRSNGYSTKPFEDCLIMLKDEQWKRVRSIVTPSFSAAKLKEMVPFISTATDTLMNNLNVHAESGEAFDIHKCFGCFTMDVIASVAFGTQVDSQNNPNNSFVRNTLEFLAMPFFRPLVVVSFLFPAIMAPFVRFVPNKKRIELDNFFISIIHKIIMQREEQPPDQRRRDFLQLMLDARNSQESVSLEHFDTTKHSDELDDKNQQKQSAVDQENGHLRSEESLMRCSQRKMMTEDEIMGQAFIFLVAGYETTSNTLAYTCYLLALHPECQRKVHEELDDFFTRHDSPDYTNIQELKYLDMVVCEALRLYPSIFKITREVANDYMIKGQLIPKGAKVEILTCFLHQDPEHWPEPEKFIPERFTPEAKANRHPFVYLPFGAGPRNCVGMRLAQLEIRMVLVHLLHRFNVVACSETKVPLNLKSNLTLSPKNGIYVKMTRRNEEGGKK